MKIAIFSDIHGNIYSLEKALKIISKYKPDKYLFLGDMAGYYYNQNECISLLDDLPNLISIKGNHDQYFLNSLKNQNIIEQLDKKYGQSYSMLYKNITKQSLDFFYNLKPHYKTNTYEAYHGSPDNNLEGYIYPNSNIEFNINIPIIFTGHTHYPMQKYTNKTLILNPGSIGQARDFNEGSFMIVDINEIDDTKVEHIRYEYNKKKLIQNIINLNDNEYLINVLKREK